MTRSVANVHYLPRALGNRRRSTLLCAQSEPVVPAHVALHRTVLSDAAVHRCSAVCCQYTPAKAASPLLRILLQVLTLALSSLFMWQPAHADFIPFGSQWNYLDGGSVPLAGWQNPGFNDSSWSRGHGKFGYGNGDETTVVDYGPDVGSRAITTYFRRQFNLSSTPADPLTLRVQRDDGVVVYLNGREVFRDNMRGGTIYPTTLAETAVHGAEEARWLTTTIRPWQLQIGTNTLAVEIHQANRASNDISFDLQLTDSPVARGPYLQQSSDTAITVRWRTTSARNSVLRYGTNPFNLNRSAKRITPTTEHLITLNGLTPDTRYYYRIGDSSGNYPADGHQYFDTHPAPGNPAPTRIWVLGDSGTADPNASAVSKSYSEFNGGPHSDVWLMLGDNAYNTGTDDEYQAAVFNMYPQSLRAC